MSLHGALRCALVFAALATPAAAHRLAFPRRLTLELARERVRLVVDQDWRDPAEARALVDRSDLDANGTLDEQERDALARNLARIAVRSLDLETTGAPLDFAPTSVSLLGPEGEGPQLDHLAVTVVLEAPITERVGARSLTLRDAAARSRRVPLEVVVADGELLQASSGRLERVGAAFRLSGALLDGAKPWTGTWATASDR